MGDSLRNLDIIWKDTDIEGDVRLGKFDIRIQCDIIVE